MEITHWEFGESVSEARKSILSAAPAFDDITQQIAREMTIVCCWKEPGDCCGHRVQYCVRVGERLFDWFFNSRNGYRAAYFCSPDEGQEANDYFIAKLLPLLLSAHADCAWAHQSLSAPSAKVWMVEPGKGPCCGACTSTWKNPAADATPDISNGRWEYYVGAYEKWGCVAPIEGSLLLMGGFVDSQGNCWIPPDKEDRAVQIHERGWS